MDETPHTTSFEAQINELENGIFTMVVTLTQLKTTMMPADVAYESVARYLQRLANGMATMTETQNEGETNA